MCRLPALRAFLGAFELGDEAANRRHTTEALEAAAGRAGHAPPALIALVRDAEDIAAARAAGISRMLRKPFGRGALLEQLQRAGLFPGSPA